uniref:Uncharacterized protein n=1 Tax=Arundo donax TaxID=35708 RepID=A0A0A8Z675_ARUDO
MHPRSNYAVELVGAFLHSFHDG